MSKEDFWKLALFYLVSAAVAAPVIGDAGITITMLALYLLHRAWVRR